MIKRIQTLVVLVSFFFNLGMPSVSFAQSSQTFLNLPVPGKLLSTSPSFTPALIKGLKIDAKNALGFNFIVDTGDTNLTGDALKQESNKMIKYFLAALTVPEKDLWVNLSPYEKDRIIVQGFGQTEMGRDMLGQDYVLKQLTASLIYPESQLGKTFWAGVYQKAREQFGTTNIPVNTFNKVWIVPDHAVIYEHNGTAFVVENKLKVMLEEDYLSLQKHMNNTVIPAPSANGRSPEGQAGIQNTSALGSQVIREVLIPEIGKEVNTGKNFATLRQIANAAVLAAWYKQALKESLLGKIYADKNKINGVDVQDKNVKMKIYNQYLQAFKKGVYNYIKEDFDPLTNRTVPRKYFSGGTFLNYSDKAMKVVTDASMSQQFLAGIKLEHVFNVSGDFVEQRAPANQAMVTNFDKAKALRNLSKLGNEFILLAIDHAERKAFGYSEAVKKFVLMDAIKKFKDKPENLEAEAVKIEQKDSSLSVLFPETIAKDDFWDGFVKYINLYADRAMVANVFIIAQRITTTQGARTGEIHIGNAIRHGAQGIIAGHSEARKNLRDDHQAINEQLKAAHKAGLPIIIHAIGETGAERAASLSATRVEDQLAKELVGLTYDQVANQIFAYEPRWAIKGPDFLREAKPEDVQNMHSFIRSEIKLLYGERTAQKVRIIYGGSVNKNNVRDYLKLDDVDGVLPGSASASLDNLEGIISAAVEIGFKKGRMPFVAGNWKTYAQDATFSQFAQFLTTLDGSKVQVAIAPQGTGDIRAMQDALLKEAGNKANQAMIAWEPITNVPSLFASVMGTYGLSKPRVEVVSLIGDLSPEAILSNPGYSFVTETSISQAFGSILFAGLGSGIKEIADGNAVYFSHLNLLSFTKNNPNHVVAVMVAEGAQDESASSKMFRIYSSSYKDKGYYDPTDVKDYNEKIQYLRHLSGKHIHYLVEDALEKTNGLVVSEALKDNTGSWALASIHDDSTGTRHGISPFWRKTGVSFNAPTDAGVDPFDLPSIAIRKIAEAHGLQHLTKEYAQYVNHLDIVVLGSRAKGSGKTSGNDRHKQIIDDAKELQTIYPGLQVITPGDGDLMARLIASLGLALDGRRMIVFGRTGAAEATAAEIAASLVKNGQFVNTFTSAKATNDLVTEELAHQYTQDELQLFKDLSYPDSAPFAIRKTLDIKGNGSVALTAVTGPSEGGHALADLLKRVTFDDKEKTTTVNTLLIVPGNVFVIRTTFNVNDPFAARSAIRQASPEARKYVTAHPEQFADTAMLTMKAGNVQELLQHISGVVTVTPKGVKVLDESKLEKETVYYLVDEARFGANDDIKKSAQRLLREIGIATGRKEAPIHDFYMERLRRGWSNMTVPAFNVRTGPTFDTMKDIFITAERAKVGMVIFELAASEMRYTYQDADEYTAMVYGAAIATGYKGLLFMQADHYQTSAADYFSGNTPEEKAAAQAKAIQKVKDNIFKAVSAGKLNIDVDPSTLMLAGKLEEVLAFERRVTTRYINNRILVDTAFAQEIEKLGGLKEKPEDESDGIWSIRRKLTDDLEIGLEIPAYKASLPAQEIEYLQKFGLEGQERETIGGLYEAAHEETKKVTKIYIEYIRGLEKQLGIKTPISIGVEERHIDNPQHAKYPSTVLGSMTLMRDIIEWCAERNYAPPSKLALQTGTMHGLGGVVDWGIYQRHQLAHREIGVAVFVQHGTSTLSPDNFAEMPKAGSGEAHLATEYQKYVFEEIGKLYPGLKSKMKAFVEALMKPEAAEADLDPGIVEKLKAAKLWDPAKREDYKNKFLKRYQDTMKGLKAQNWNEDDIFTGMLGDTLAKPYTGKLKDLIKELAAPFKREIAELPQNVYDAIHGRMQEEFDRIYKAQNVKNTRELIESFIPYESVEVALPSRPKALTAAAVDAQVIKADQASVAKMTPEGGINLDPAMYSIQIKRDGRGIPLPVDQQPIDKINISGIRVVIQTVTPANLPLMLGIAQTSETLAMSN